MFKNILKNKILKLLILGFSLVLQFSVFGSNRSITKSSSSRNFREDYSFDTFFIRLSVIDVSKIRELRKVFQLLLLNRR